jgi:hypothetical protein
VNRLKGLLEAMLGRKTVALRRHRKIPGGIARGAEKARIGTESLVAT